MPEGDTIWRAAARLRPALAGQPLRHFEATRIQGDRPRPGVVIEEVEAVGKHLLVHFAGGLSLDTHMRMTGSWHLYRTGERWRKPRHLLRCGLVVAGWEAVCFSAPVVRTYRRDGRANALGHVEDPVGHLGPNLCSADADLDDALRRMDTHAEPGTTIAEVLLDQTVAAGIGNVYKSETLFACGLDPFTPIEAVGVDLRRKLLDVATRQLRRNVNTSRRTTVEGPPGSVAVYGRQRRGCRRCGTPIRVVRHGAQARSTYWCPSCQRRPPSVAPTARGGG